MYNLYLKIVHFKVILNINSSDLIYVISENLIIRNEFNSYNMDWNSLCIFKINCHNQYYMSITWVAIEFIPYENFITGDNE